MIYQLFQFKCSPMDKKWDKCNKKDMVLISFLLKRPTYHDPLKTYLLRNNILIHQKLNNFKLLLHMLEIYLNTISFIIIVYIVMSRSGGKSSKVLHITPYFFPF